MWLSCKMVWRMDYFPDCRDQKEYQALTLISMDKNHLNLSLEHSFHWTKELILSVHQILPKSKICIKPLPWMPNTLPNAGLSLENAWNKWLAVQNLWHLQFPFTLLSSDTNTISDLSFNDFPFPFPSIPVSFLHSHCNPSFPFSFNHSPFGLIYASGPTTIKSCHDPSRPCFLEHQGRVWLPEGWHVGLGKVRRPRQCL